MKRIFGRTTKTIYPILGAIIFFFSCSTANRVLFGKRTPREIYENSITEAGLKTTVLGTLWFNTAEKALNLPVNIKLPYKETGYFAAEQPTATGYIFNVHRGDKLNIDLTTDPVAGFVVFADLWYSSPNASFQFLRAADTLNHNISYEAEKDGSYLLRIQPELLRSGEYTVTITTAPSLTFPVPSGNKAVIGSFWGASRDNGARHHE